MNSQQGDFLSNDRDSAELRGHDLVADNSGSVLDEQIGLRHVFGNKELYKRVKKSFYDSNKTIMSQLNDALAASDANTAVRICHTIKGLSNTLGAKRLHTASQDLELHFRDNGLSVDSDKMLLFESELNLLLSHISNELNLE